MDTMESGDEFGLVVIVEFDKLDIARKSFDGALATQMVKSASGGMQGSKEATMSGEC